MSDNRNCGGGVIRGDLRSPGYDCAMSRVHARGSIENGGVLVSGPSHHGGVLVGGVIRLVAGARLFCHAGVLHLRGLWQGNPGALVHGRGEERLSGISVESRDLFRGAVGRRGALGLLCLGTVAALSGCAQPEKPVAKQRISIVRIKPARPLVIRSHWLMPHSPVADIQAMRAPFVEPSVPETRHTAVLPLGSSTAQGLGERLTAEGVKHLIPMQGGNANGKSEAVRINPWHCKVEKPGCPGGDGRKGATWWACTKSPEKAGAPLASAARLTGIQTARFSGAPANFNAKHSLLQIR